MASETFVTLILNQNSVILGNLRDLPQEPVSVPTTAITKTRSVTVTGVTDSRLEEVKTYNINSPYIEGINGVQSVTETAVVYVLDGVTYTTSLGTGDTTYSLGIVETEEALGTHFLYRNERDVFIDKRETQADILMARSELSAFDPMLRIASINSLDDLTDYFK